MVLALEPGPGQVCTGKHLISFHSVALALWEKSLQQNAAGEQSEPPLLLPEEMYLQA